MKSILLASTAVIALAGAAAAEVSFGGDVTLGYNSNDIYGAPTDNHDGFYWDASVDVTLSQTLDNGLTASATFDLSMISSGYLSGSVTASGYVLSLVADNAGLYFGDTAYAAETHWAAAGDMTYDDFSAADGDIAIRGEMSFGGWDAAVSYVWDEASTGGDDTLDQLSVGISGAFGSVNVAVAYQAEETDYTAATGDFTVDEIFGLSVGTSFSGADVTFAYAVDNTAGENSMGFAVSYPAGPVTIGGWYVVESDATLDNGYGFSADYANGPIAVSVAWESVNAVEDWSIEGSYDVGNGLMVMAGVADAGDDYFLAGSYDLGNGAALLASYATDDSIDSADEIGGAEYQEGTTIELSFAF